MAFKPAGSQCWCVIGWNVLEWPRSMQAIDLKSQRWHMIGSRSPVAQSSADAPQPMNKSMTDRISTGALHVCQQYDHLSAQQQTIHLALSQ